LPKGLYKVVKMKAIIVFIFYLMLQQLSFAQTNRAAASDGLSLLLPTDTTTPLHIQQIIITGNKKTKEYIILREVQFKVGDTILSSNLASEIYQAKQQIYNTTLFYEVKIVEQFTTTNSVIIHIILKERWYIFPVPQFKPVDRNFNEWIQTYGGSLTRVNYGLKFIHYNLTGRRDQLRVFLLNGYTRDVSLSYSNPNTNKALTEGLSIDVGFSQNREIAYKTSYNNKIQFYPGDTLKKVIGDFVRDNWYVNAGYRIRKGFFASHSFNIGYSFLKVNDSVIAQKFNPNYFNSNKTQKSFIDLFYTYQYRNVDNVAYPLKGKAYGFSIFKRGFGFTGGTNVFLLEADYSKFIELQNKWYLSFQLNGKLKLPFEQAYINQQALGYGENYLRGLEIYVIDGVASSLIKSTIKRKIFSFKTPFPFKNKTINKIPFTFYAKTFADFGFVYTKKKYETNLNNRLLYSAGFGIDLLTLYDINLRFEYSFNQLNQNGLFLHTQSGL
jgi:outer membrane protein assembly factor BamA